MAPFYRFLEVGYSMEYIKTGNSIGTGEIVIKTEVQFSAFRKIMATRQYDVTFANSKLSRFAIHRENKKIVLNRV